jgi:ferrous iron transport protein A
LYRTDPFVKLSELPRGGGGIVIDVEPNGPNDAIARRLRDLGFVSGEAVSVLAFGPVGSEPILVRIGDARFALRRAEAARVRLQDQTP